MREFLLENDEMLDNNKNKIPFLLSVHHLVAEGGLALKNLSLSFVYFKPADI